MLFSPSPVAARLVVIGKICLHYILLAEILRLRLRSAQNDSFVIVTLSDSEGSQDGLYKDNAHF